MKDRILYIIMGAIGTGKSTLAKIIAQKYDMKVLSADEIEKEVYQNDIDTNVESEIVENFLYLLDQKESFILDGLNLSEVSRKLYISHAAKCGYKIFVYDLGPGDKYSLNRRLASPRNIPKTRWEEIAQSNIYSYQKPSIIKECIDKLYTLY